jgi:hypothetical protein
MTQLLSLLRRVFSNPTKSHDLDHFINSRSPTSHQQVEEITREYLYSYYSSKGL